MIQTSLPREVEGPDITDDQSQIPPSRTSTKVASALPPTSSNNTRKASHVNGDGDDKDDVNGEKAKGKTKGKGKLEGGVEGIGGEGGMIDGRPRDVYDRFTRAQKVRMTAIVSFSALLSREPHLPPDLRRVNDGDLRS